MAADEEAADVDASFDLKGKEAWMASDADSLDKAWAARMESFGLIYDMFVQDLGEILTEEDYERVTAVLEVLELRVPE